MPGYQRPDIDREAWAGGPASILLHTVFLLSPWDNLTSWGQCRGRREGFATLLEHVPSRQP